MWHQSIIAEGNERLAPGACEVCDEPARIADGAHPLAATTGRRLDEQRVADSIRGCGQGRIGLVFDGGQLLHDLTICERVALGRRYISMDPIIRILSSPAEHMRKTS